jgi:hypothetical protein
MMVLHYTRGDLFGSRQDMLGWGDQKVAVRAEKALSQKPSQEKIGRPAMPSLGVPPASPEDEDTAVQYMQFAVGRWHLIFELFKLEDRKARVVTSEAFVRWCRRLGFEGDLKAVIREIRRESQNFGPRWGWRGGENEGFDMDFKDQIFLPQLQCFRRCKSTAAVDALVSALKARRDTVLRAWRLDFDLKGCGRVDKADFERACRMFGRKDDMPVVWEKLRPGSSGANTSSAPLFFHDLAEIEAENLQRFAEGMLVKCGIDISRCWDLLEPSGQGVLDRDDFIKAASEMGLDSCCDLPLIFKGLDASGQGRMWCEDLDYLWVIALPEMAPERRRARLRRLTEQGTSNPLGTDCGAGQAFLAKLSSTNPGAPDSGYGGESKLVTRRLENLGFREDVLRAGIDLVRALLREEQGVDSRNKHLAAHSRPLWDPTFTIVRYAHVGSSRLPNQGGSHKAHSDQPAARTVMKGPCLMGQVTASIYATSPRSENIFHHNAYIKERRNAKGQGKGKGQRQGATMACVMNSGSPSAHDVLAPPKPRRKPETPGVGPGQWSGKNMKEILTG